MNVVDIREDIALTPFCTLCKIPVTATTTNRREAELAAARHEVEHHPEPEGEDA
jgi:hypothetical protein